LPRWLRQKLSLLATTAYAPDALTAKLAVIRRSEYIQHIAIEHDSSESTRPPKTSLISTRCLTELPRDHGVKLSVDATLTELGWALGTQLPGSELATTAIIDARVAAPS